MDHAASVAAPRAPSPAQRSVDRRPGPPASRDVDERHHDPVDHIVEVGMDSIDGDIMLDSGNDRFLHVILSIDLFQSPENDGMMRHNEIAFFLDRFFHYFFDGIE